MRFCHSADQAAVCIMVSTAICRRVVGGAVCRRVVGGAVVAVDETGNAIVLYPGIP